MSRCIRWLKTGQSSARLQGRRGLKPALLSAAALGCAFVAGCATPALDDPARTGPFYSPSNHAGEAQLPAGLRRVVLMPLAGGAAAGSESAAALDPVFVAELQKQNRFEIVPMTRDDCLHHFHAEELSSTAPLPSNFLDFVRRQYAADAVLFVDVTVFKPYRPIALGVRAKLATLGDDVKLLWTFDNVFSTADSAVANAARHHFLESDRRGLPGDSTQSVLESPSRFASYVAAAMFATLPPVNAPAPAPKTAAGEQNPR